MRKEPVQARAKQRVERILDATEALVVEDGVANLTVNNIAARAEVPIGSMYQYFTNRDEVLRALARRHYRALDSLLAQSFSDVRSVEDFLRDVRRSLTTCWRYTRDNEGFGRLFFDAEAWEIMRETDWEDTFVNAQRMSSALQPLLRLVPPKRIMALCIIIGDGASATARLALRFGELHDELFDEMLELVESRIYSLLRENAGLERKADGLGAMPDLTTA